MRGLWEITRHPKVDRYRLARSFPSDDASVRDGEVSIYGPQPASAFADHATFVVVGDVHSTEWLDDLRQDFPHVEFVPTQRALYLCFSHIDYAVIRMTAES